MSEKLTHATGAGVDHSQEESAQYLTFFAADERYAIGILDVKEIIETGQMTRVPMTPRHIRGVINLRGNVLPVVDLSARLGKGRAQITKRTCIVLVEVDSRGERQQLGMMVDEVKEILEIPGSHLQPPPDFGTDIRTDFIQAMGRVDEVFIILLDIGHVLSVDELNQLNALGRRLGQDLHQGLQPAVGAPDGAGAEPGVAGR